MSQDQRPGRVRMVANAAPAAPVVEDAPQRRRSDAVAAEAPMAGAAGSAAGMIPALLFLVGCAAGGALATFFDVWGVLLR